VILLVGGPIVPFSVERFSSDSAGLLPHALFAATPLPGHSFFIGHLVVQWLRDSKVNDGCLGSRRVFVFPRGILGRTCLASYSTLKPQVWGLFALCVGQ